ncbi:MAG: hypothetical protein V3R64_01895 [Sphingomonadales bacterium]
MKGANEVKFFRSTVVHIGGFKYSYMMLGWFKIVGLVLLAGVLLGGCANSSRWASDQTQYYVPEQTETLDYFLYNEPGPPFCGRLCKNFQVYIFSNGEISYYGGPALKVSGWKTKTLDPFTLSIILKILDRHGFSALAERHNGIVSSDLENRSCGVNYLIEPGGLFLKTKIGPIERDVSFNNDCTGAKDYDTILHMARSIRQLIALEKWVGKKEYTWDYEIEYQNVNLKEDK